MDTALSLIQSLGINTTVWIQLAIFLVSFIILNYLVFRPYFRAHFERHARTEGGREGTSQVLQSNQLLQSEYEQKARTTNDKIRLVFEKAKSDALLEQTNVLNRAREGAHNQLRISREKLEKELQLARQQLTQEVREIGLIIANKLIGSEKSANGRGAVQ